MLTFLNSSLEKIGDWMSSPMVTGVFILLIYLVLQLVILPRLGVSS